jgi:hypothetical protein
MCKPETALFICLIICLFVVLLFVFLEDSRAVRGDIISGSKISVRLKVVMHAGNLEYRKLGAQVVVRYRGAAMRGSAAF